jgi:XTP/dITP diphosphohydrolase
MTVVVASAAEWKLAELRALLHDLPAGVISARELLGEATPIVEDGETFEVVAERRATATARVAGMLTVAEAGGLEVDALGGRPGVRSGRFAHERATDAENNAALLSELEEVDGDDRSARFRSVLCLASPWHDEVVLVEGSTEGTIARTPRGGGGFGYEPLFVVRDAKNRVMAELGESDKRLVSARARATRALAPRLLAVLNDLLDATERVAG